MSTVDRRFLQVCQEVCVYHPTTAVLTRRVQITSASVLIVMWVWPEMPACMCCFGFVNKETQGRSCRKVSPVSQLKSTKLGRNIRAVQQGVMAQKYEVGDKKKLISKRDETCSIDTSFTSSDTSSSSSNQPGQIFEVGDKNRDISTSEETSSSESTSCGSDESVAGGEKKKAPKTTVVSIIEEICPCLPICEGEETDSGTKKDEEESKVEQPEDPGAVLNRIHLNAETSKIRTKVTPDYFTVIRIAK
ncbi:hypothetical protein MAR_006796 [Mya arenaria]|uniref:Uncharacterized protein n=1 Tax=Mya arenaria TaxID=6604 RepID=A0ABY7DH47_MYAAR|nr:hypothetical protein MAR_006796 [Mya arenaria]